MQQTRRQARERAIQMLTAADLNPPEDIDAFITSFWEEIQHLHDEDPEAVVPPTKLRAFAEERVRGVLATQGELDGALGPLLENWDLYRLGTVERAVLRMGVWEILNTDVPKAVVINEAIDLVNWFATPRSRTLVNGVLDKCRKPGE